MLSFMTCRISLNSWYKIYLLEKEKEGGQEEEQESEGRDAPALSCILFWNYPMEWYHPLFSSYTK